MRQAGQASITSDRGLTRRAPAAAGELPQMKVGIAEHRVDHRGAFEVMADLVLHGHADAAMQLDRLLADQPRGTADLHLCGRERVAPFSGIFLGSHHRREHYHAARLLQGYQHVDSTVLKDLKAADLASELAPRL